MLGKKKKAEGAIMWWLLNTPGGNFFLQMDKQEKKYKK